MRERREKVRQKKKGINREKRERARTENRGTLKKEKKRNPRKWNESRMGMERRKGRRRKG